MTSAALNFVGGIPFQLLYDSVKMALDRTRKFRSHLTNLQFTLDCLKPRIIEQIGENNFELNLPNDIVQDLKTKMNEGKVLVDRLLELSMWNIRIWGNCYNCLGPNCAQQLDELDRSLRILLEQLEMEQRRNVTELLILAKNTKDKQEELEKRQLDILRGQQEMLALLMEQHNAIGKIVSNSVQQVASSNGGGGGAAPALGLVFGVLFDAVIKVKVKNVMFKRLLRKFKSTLYCSQPLIEEISKCNKVLHLPKEEVEYFVMQIKNGVELVHKFSEVHKRANYNKCTYTNRILNLDESLQRLLIELNGQVKRNVKEAMDSANEIEAVIKKIEGGGWAQNNEFGSEGQSRTRLPPPGSPTTGIGSPTIGLDVLNMQQGPRDVNKETLVDLARITEEEVKPIEASDAVQNQLETPGSCEVPPPPAVGLDVLNMQGPSDVIEETFLDLARVKQEMIKPNEVETLDSTTRNIEVGVMETEGTEVVVSTRDVQETMEIAIAETEPPSPTVGLDVHGTRDVKVTLDMPRNVLKQIECEIATAEPPSSSPAVGLTLDPTSNIKTGLKQPEEEKEAVLEHLKWSTNASMTSFKRKHSETEIMMQATPPFPEECTANIISRTTPADVCRLSLVSRNFKLAAECDEIWEKFLPPDIHTILSQSTFTSTSAAKAKSKSKKDFYLALCDNPVLMDNGKMSFSLDKWSGKKCYTICARALHIVWSEEKFTYWKWISVPESRFEEVACLENVCWLEIRGRIDTRMLSPSTLYKAYLVYKLTENAYSLDVPVEVTTRTRHYGFEYENLDHWFREYEDKQRGYLDPERQINGAQSPKERVDGWLELELGEFLCQGEEEEDGELEMICVEMHDLSWKRGLIVQGIEVRPATKKGKARSHLRAKGKNALTII